MLRMNPASLQAALEQLQDAALEHAGWRDHLLRVVSDHAGLSAPFPKLVIHRGGLGHELRKERGTSNSMILVPLFDLKFLEEFVASGVGTSDRRHQASNVRVRLRRGRDRP